MKPLESLEWASDIADYNWPDGFPQAGDQNYNYECIDIKSPGNVRCVHGANEQNLPIRGRTVRWARSNLAHSLNLAPGALSFLDGLHVEEETVLEAGGHLEFLTPIASKGAGRIWTIEEFCELFKINSDQWQHLLCLGLPHLRWPDGTIRIPEEQVDRFFDQLLGLARRPDVMPPEFLSPPDAAAFLGIQAETLEHLRKTRKIRVIQIGHQRGFIYAVADLRAFAGRRTIPTGDEERKSRGGRRS
jgi:hypothetical protein